MYVENLYINAIVQFMQGLNISCLQIKTLENSRKGHIKTDQCIDESMITFIDVLKENDLLSLDQVIMASKLILREYFWCKLVSSKKMYVHFGYDYYMYIGSSSECKDVIQNITASGLYVESFKSPYL